MTRTTCLTARRGLKRTCLAVTAAALTTAAFLGSGVPAADASADSCAAAPKGYTCNITRGWRTKVDKVTVARTKFSWDGICSYSASVEILGPRGDRQFFRSTGVVRDGECVYGRAWIDFPINSHFPSGSRVITRFYEDGKQQGGGVFVGIN